MNIKGLVIKMYEKILVVDDEIQIRDTNLESVMQIFINILDNSIKYNKPNGEIFVSNYIDDVNISVVIRDTGIGIPFGSKDKIFEPFYRVDKELSKQTGGIGLGLALVKKLVEMQNGTIELLDIEEKGTAIKISFPIYFKSLQF